MCTSSRRPSSASPRISSLWPHPYTSAVSMKFTPSSRARRTAAIDSASSVGPYEFPCAFPPIAQAPKPISETLSPVRPRIRVLIPRRTELCCKNLALLAGLSFLGGSSIVHDPTSTTEVRGRVAAARSDGTLRRSVRRGHRSHRNQWNDAARRGRRDPTEEERQSASALMRNGADSSRPLEFLATENEVEFPICKRIGI